MLHKGIEECAKLIQNSIENEPLRIKREQLKLERLERIKQERARLEKELEVPKKTAQALRKFRAEVLASKKTTSIEGKPEYLKAKSGVRHVEAEEPLRERMGSPKPFDEKYKIALAYQFVQETLPPKECAGIVKKIAEYAADVVKRKNFNSEELRKMVFDFNKSFEVRLPDGGIVPSDLNPKLGYILK